MSTFLKYNNHMILHPTDSSKYLYGIVEEPPTPPFDEVTIGSQTWMSKNLAIDDGQGGIYTKTVNYGQGDVVEYYYDWFAAVRVAASVEGWHLPTLVEWKALSSAVSGSTTGGTKLKSKYGWITGNGTDDYGFAAFPAGYLELGSGFNYFGSMAAFWTATEVGFAKPGDSYYYWFSRFETSMTDDTDSQVDAYSVRLIKD